MTFTPSQTEALHLYEALLKKWSGAINLVAPSTLPHIWARHFEDSAGIVPYLPILGRVADLGSGAGFPGLIIALMAPHLEVTLLESDGRKGEFLKEVKRQLKLGNAHIVTHRIESFRAPQPFGCITARACASLAQLLEWSAPLRGPQSKALFLKGQNHLAEIDEARQTYDFKCAIHPNGSDGVILELDAIVLKSPGQ